jgi:hypothetical protein
LFHDYRYFYYLTNDRVHSATEIVLLANQRFPDRIRRFDFGAVSEKVDDLLQGNWENRKAEWH